MMLRSLSADFLKIRGKGIWLLIILAPLGVVAIEALNFGLRFDYLGKIYADDLWGGLVGETTMFVPISLYLGCTLVSSLIANVEHQLNSWKQLLALPISRTAVFSGKFTLSVLLLFVSCIVLSIGTIILGMSLGFGTHIPWKDLLTMGFFPFLATMPILSLQLWLSLTFQNQTLPVSLGVLISLLSPFLMQLSEWFPLNWPIMALRSEHQFWFIGFGIGVGIIIMLIGLVHFNRKDVD
ncbi:ABC transporter permease [Paenibacillus motobuensis]|uniref:ABC transporter permease n=1 Tax=Paenibacillus motobuensis TaxID=295324 RepID=UPI0036257B2E